VARTLERAHGEPTSAAAWRESVAAREENAPAIVTGSGGLNGSESVAHFVEAHYDVIGIDNDLRTYISLG
jgi:hypothetical protein